MAKRLCPDCGTEGESDLQFCGKCQLDLDSYFNMDRILSVREKVQKQNQDEERKKKETEEKEKRGRGGLASLIGKRKPQ